MTDLAPRLAPRSAGADADFELLRVARTDLDEVETAATMTLAERLRGLASFRVTRPAGDGAGGGSRFGRREG